MRGLPALPRLPNRISRALFWHELRVLALSPSTVVFLCLAWALTAGTVFWVGDMFASNKAELNLLFGYLPWVMALVVPALAMQMWADDWRRGIAERLLSLPLSLEAMVVTRFTVLWLAVAVFVLGTWPLLATVAWLGSPDYGPVLAGYIGAILLGGVLLAWAMVVAAASPGAVVALVGGVVALLLILFSGWQGITDLFPPLRHASLLEHYRRFALGVIDLRSVCVMVALIGFGLVVQVAILKIITRRGRAWWPLLPKFVAAALIVLVGHLLPLRLDLTADGTYTLSPASISMLEKLQKPVTFTVYESADPAVPQASRALGRRLRDVLADMRAVNPAMVKIENVVPDADVAAEVRTRGDGIAEQPLPGGQGFYLGVRAVLDGRGATIPALEADRMPYLEFDLMSLLAEVRRIDRKTLTVLSTTNTRLLSNRPQWLTELQGFYNLETMLPGQPEVPSTTDVLLVMMNRYLPVESLYAIDQYLVKGGRVLLMMDPYYRTAPDETLSTPDRNADALGLDHPADLLRTWGMVYDGQSIVADPSLASMVTEENLGSRAYPFWLKMTGANVNRALPFTSYVDDITLAEAGELAKGEVPDGLVYDPVLTTSARAQVVPRGVFDSVNPQLYGTKLQGNAQARNVAAMLSGKFTSAFPETPEAVRNYHADYAAEGVAAEVPPHHIQSTGQGALLVFADEDFMSAGFTLDKDPDGNVVPMNDNLVLFFNAVQYLAGEGELLDVRGKAVSARPFARVEEAVRMLGARYVQLENRMAGELYIVTQRLEALKQQQQDTQQAREAAAKEVQTFEARTLALKRQLRDIRSRLAQDVKVLEYVLAALNMVVMPGLALGGYFWVRGRRRRKK